MRIFLYESMSTGDLGDDVPASLQREGAAMLGAISADFARLPGNEVVAAKKVSGPFFDFALIIAPEFDDLLEDHSQTVLDSAGRLLGSLPSAIRLTGDKLALADYWREHGVPHPRTQLLDPVA